MTLDYATLDRAALRTLLHERLCEVVNVAERPDGALMLLSNFCFPDGDGYPIHLLEAPAGGVRLSDEGHTLMHISFEHDIDAIIEGPGRVLMDRVLDESGVGYDDGAFYLDTAPERLPEAMFTFGQALTCIYEIGRWPVDGDRRPVAGGQRPERGLSARSGNISLLRRIKASLQEVNT